jgi:WD40 repeat protein
MKGHEFYIASIMFSPDSRYILSEGPESVRVWDAATGECVRILDEFGSQISSATYSPDGRFILVADYESVRFYDAATGTFQAALIGLKDNHWVVTAPDGRYDSSDAGESRFLRWTVLDESYPVIQLKDQYYTPNLLGKILHG